MQIFSAGANRATLVYSVWSGGYGTPRWFCLIWYFWVWDKVAYEAKKLLILAMYKWERSYYSYWPPLSEDELKRIFLYDGFRTSRFLVAYQPYCSLVSDRIEMWMRSAYSNYDHALRLWLDDGFWLVYMRWWELNRLHVLVLSCGHLSYGPFNSMQMIRTGDAAVVQKSEWWGLWRELWELIWLDERVSFK